MEHRKRSSMQHKVELTTLLRILMAGQAHAIPTNVYPDRMISSLISGEHRASKKADHSAGRDGKKRNGLKREDAVIY